MYNVEPLSNEDQLIVNLDKALTAVDQLAAINDDDRLKEAREFLEIALVISLAYYFKMKLI